MLFRSSSIEIENPIASGVKEGDGIIDETESYVSVFKGLQHLLNSNNDEPQRYVLFKHFKESITCIDDEKLKDEFYIFLACHYKNIGDLETAFAWCNLIHADEEKKKLRKDLKKTQEDHSIGEIKRKSEKKKSEGDNNDNRS